MTSHLLFHNRDHLRWGNDERFYWKMLSIACDKIRIVKFIFGGQCDFVKNYVFFIGNSICGFRFVKVNGSVFKSRHKSRDNVGWKIKLFSPAYFPILALNFSMHNRNYLSRQRHFQNFARVGIFFYERRNNYVCVKNSVNFFHSVLLSRSAKRNLIVDFIERPVLKPGFFRKVVCLFKKRVNFIGASFVLTKIEIGDIIKGRLTLCFRKRIVHFNHFLWHRHLQNKNIYYLVYIKIKNNQQRFRDQRIFRGAFYE